MTSTEKVKSLVNKTIIEVKVMESWRTKSIDNLIIKFADGSEVEFSATTDSGCNECDCDGRNETTITVDLKDTKGEYV